MQVAARIQENADAALEILAGINADGGSPELVATLGDIRAMAVLGRYYACKIRGATGLALFRKTGRPEHQQAAIIQLTEAAAHWDAYVAQVSAQYLSPHWTNRVGTVDWEELRGEVARDIEIARGAKAQ
jgi:hypothetical protein